MMYRCENGHVFEAPKVFRDKIGDYTDSLAPGFLYWDVCPVCDDDSIEVVEKCKCCYEEYTADGFCESCVDKANELIEDGIQHFIKSYMADRDDVVELFKDIVKEKE